MNYVCSSIDEVAYVGETEPFTLVNFVDESHAIHWDCKGYTSAISTLGIDETSSQSTNNKFLFRHDSF